MCDDHQPSRRQFLHGAAAAAALAAVPAGLRRPAPPRLPLRSPLRPTAGGSQAYSMAMHIHSSFSEETGSMDAQLFQAQANSVDVLWWTDHGERMFGWEYRDVVHFTSLTGETPPAGQGGKWTWQAQTSGSLSSKSGGGIVTSPVTPNDPAPHGSLRVTAQALSGTARYGFWADAKPAVWNYRDNLNGQTISIDVLLNTGWSKGYLEVAVASSTHTASGGRPGGQYALSYRIVPAGSARRVAQGNTGVITIPATAGTWTTITIDPATDIAALWPDLDARDFALFGLNLNAVSTAALVSGYFGYLRFDRTLNGGELLTQQQDMMNALAAKYPRVTQWQGLEISWPPPHVNWFGNVSMPDFSTVTSKDWPAWVRQTVIPQIHNAGGVASYNHPYGTQYQPQLSQSQQDALLTQTATALLGNRAMGADILEVGYPLRAGVDLAHHLELWNVLSRNAVFLTGNGVSDDHSAGNWRGLGNNWVTCAWAASTAQSALVAALAAGQVWCGSLSEFPASGGAALNLDMDGTCPMGSVSLSSLPARRLTLTATGVPAGGSVAVLQGAVDYAGTADPSDNTKTVTRFTAAELAAAGGQATLPVDTTAESFALLSVADAAGTVVSLSNPVWMLHSTPPGGIPAPRRA